MLIGVFIGFVAAAVNFLPVIVNERRFYNERLAKEHREKMRVLENLILDD